MKRVTRLLIMVVVIIGLIAGAWWVLRESIDRSERQFVGNNMEVSEEVKERYEEGELGISNNSEKINLRASGANEGMGMATREKAGEVFLHTISANLPNPPLGKFYEAWLIREGEEESRVYTGKLVLTKAGWLLEYVGRRDLSDHDLVWVTLEESDDQRPEEKILEGKF